MELTTRLQNYLREKRLDVLFFQNPESIGYLTGFFSEPHERILALLVFADAQPILFTPALDHEQAQRSVPQARVISYLDHQNPWQVLKEACPFLSDTAHFGIEQSYMRVSHYFALQATFPDARITHNITPYLEYLRLRKTPNEIALMREAGRAADFALHVGAKAMLEQPTEQELVAEIEYQLKRHGVSKMSFDTMVLTEKNAANPHGVPGTHRITPGQFTLFDLGTLCHGYASDVSRTFFYGTNASNKQRLVYQTVYQAQQAALAAVRPGITAAELDKIARDIISDAGFGPYFTHRLGHGIGQSLHEYPSIMEGNNLVIEEGMCFSIEPGIYLPNEMGVRIEDCVVVTANGCQPFTHTPHDIYAWQRLIDEPLPLLH